MSLKSIVTQVNQLVGGGAEGMNVGTSRVKFDHPFRSEDELVDTVARFEGCTLPFSAWTHRAHLAVALCYLRADPFEVALARMRHHIPLYNRTLGDPVGYHDTITVLFLRRVARYLDDNPDGPSLAVAVEELAAECDSRWSLKYYSPERLWSTEARAGWMEPDLQPLDF